MKKLTKRQYEVISFIEEFINNNHYAPSYREIQQHFGLASLGSIYKYIYILKNKGLIKSDHKARRSMALTMEIQKPSVKAEIEIPFIGLIAAGMPIQTFSQRQQIVVPRSFVHNPEKTYALRVQGHTLNEELIAEGDILVVEARQEAHPGETIVALVNNQDTVIKKFYPEDSFIRLMGVHAHHHPITLRQDDIVIQGIVTGLLRIFG